MKEFHNLMVKNNVATDVLGVRVRWESIKNGPLKTEGGADRRGFSEYS